VTQAGEQFDTGRRGGRPPITSRGHLASVALDLFAARGFDAVTVDDVAEHAGISRRTVFRYVASKNDLVWGDFDGELTRLQDHLAVRPVDEPVMRSIRTAVVATNSFTVDDLPELRQRMQLLTSVPTLQAHSTLRYTEWREVIATYAGHRLGVARDELVPQALGYATLGVTLAAFLRWVRSDLGELRPVLDRALAELEAGFPDPGVTGPH
jgi:TetR/AcrR family transcriptional regulator, regulator of mycofactocin system